MEDATGKEQADPVENYRDPDFWVSIDTAGNKKEIPEDVVDVLKKAHEVIPSHAGGVVYRHRNGQIVFFLVPTKDRWHHVLPEGYINPDEDAGVAAERAVKEQLGYELERRWSLGAFSFATETRKVTTTYFLMEDATKKEQADPHEKDRASDWFTIDDARNNTEIPKDVFKVLKKAREVIPEDIH